MDAQENGESPELARPQGRVSLIAGWALRQIDKILLILIAAIGVWQGTEAIRASNRMAALHYISENGNNISKMETEREEVLCIYHWGSATSRALRTGCESIFIDNDDPSKLSNHFNYIQLYIEESLLFFAESRRMEKKYGARFFGGLNYWRIDFSHDETGAMAYYVLSRELEDKGTFRNTSPDSLVCLERLTNIQFENICTKYDAFLDDIKTKGPRVPLERNQADSCKHLDDLSEARVRVEGNQSSCDGNWWTTNFGGARL